MVEEFSESEELDESDEVDDVELLEEFVLDSVLEASLRAVVLGGVDDLLIDVPVS